MVVNPGLTKLVLLFATAGAALSLTYVVPQLAPFRPWIEGEPIPFEVWWKGFPDQPVALPQFASQEFPEGCGGNQAALAQKAGVNEALMAEALAAQNASDDEELLAPPPEVEAVAPGEEGTSPGAKPGPNPPQEPGGRPTEPSAPVAPKTAPPGEAPTPGADAKVAPDGAATSGDEPGAPLKRPAVKPGEAPQKPAPKAPEYVVEADAYRGIPRELEDPSGKAMDRFYEALLKTALRRPGAVTRISHWGASVIGADGMTSVARHKLQKRFGSAGKGWVNLAPGWNWYRQKDVVFKPKGWAGKTVTSHKLKRARYGAGRYGFGGVAAIGYSGAKTTYRVYANELELYYMTQPKGGALEIIADGGAPTVVETASETVTDRWKRVTVPGKGEHTFEVRAKGRTHAYGVTLERPGPGVVYDCLGMIGTRASRILNYDPEHLKAQVQHRRPDLQIIMFGGNELVDKGMNMRIYGEKYTEVIRRLRAGAPNASCIMMTPVDHGEKRRGRVRTVPMLKRMITVQQAVADKMGCAFFNTYEAMGGADTMGRWYYKARPRLAWGDFAHLTKAGDAVLGAMIYKALMKGFADWLLRRAQGQ